MTAAPGLAEINEASPPRPGNPGPPAYPVVAELSSEIVARSLIVTLGTAALEIEVVAEGGVVRLTGDVPTAPLRRMAVETAAAVEGVGAVVNELGLEPPAGSDQELGGQVVAVLGAAPGTAGQPIQIRSAGHVIFLDGRVSSDALAQRSEDLARAIRGVTQVVNRLSPLQSHVGPRSDHDIERAVARRLDRLSLIGNVQVTAREGRIELRGWLERAEDRREALAAAWVLGAWTVDGRALKLVSSKQGQRPSLPAVEPVEDAALHREMSTALAEDDRFAAAIVTVEVDRGAITLRGRIPTEGVRRAAEAIARSISGVRRVQSLLRVDAGLVRPDRKLEGLVRASLASDPHVDGRQIQVMARRGRVVLSGRVDAPFEVERAGFLASGVPGVVSVQNGVRYAPAAPPVTGLSKA